MRIRVLLTVLGLVAALAAIAPSQADVTDVPFVPRPCSGQEGDELFNRPASCQRILYKVGPLHVTPGDNLILVGPIAIEKPMIDGYIVRFKPNLERVDGTIPDIDILHLHHAVWFSTSQGGSISDPLFASGEEKTIVRIPDGYGIPVRPYDGWLLNYMLHNQTPIPDNVFVTYELDFIPSSSVPAGSIKPVRSYWIDVGAHNGLNPVYNTQRGFGTNGECAYPKDQCAAIEPYGRTDVVGQGRGGNGRGKTRSIPAGTVVWMQGHVHPGGLRTEVIIDRGGATEPVFTSHAVYYDPGGPISWDMSMEVTPPNFRLRVNSGDQFIMNSVYETVKGSWYEGMGIVVMYSADGDMSGLDPFQVEFNPNGGVLTHKHMEEAENYGGGGEGPPITSQPSILPFIDSTIKNTNDVRISLFRYLPGISPRSLSFPSVARGSSLTFTNLDAGASIFHTVTSCKNPCDGGTGISYPLANGPVDFDSLELGIGPGSGSSSGGFQATPASNRVSYTLSTSNMNTGVYTYFCRVHPFMRGAFEVR